MFDERSVRGIISYDSTYDRGGANITECIVVHYSFIFFVGHVLLEMSRSTGPQEFSSSLKGNVLLHPYLVISTSAFHKVRALFEMETLGCDTTASIANRTVSTVINKCRIRCNATRRRRSAETVYYLGLCPFC